MDDETLDVKQIVWSQAAVSQEKLGKAATIEWVSGKLNTSISTEWQGQIQYKIQQVKEGNGSTLFALLKEILSSNRSISLRLG